MNKSTTTLPVVSKSTTYAHVKFNEEIKHEFLRECVWIVCVCVCYVFEWVCVL